jgi:hypothetical protein
MIFAGIFDCSQTAEEGGNKGDCPEHKGIIIHNSSSVKGIEKDVNLK